MTVSSSMGPVSCEISTKLLDAGRLPDPIAQVVELGATDVTATHGLDLGDDRGMNGENPLDADPETQLADREGGSCPAPLRAMTRPSKIWTALSAALDHPNVDFDGVARPKLGDIVADVRALNYVKIVHGGLLEAPGVAR